MYVIFKTGHKAQCLTEWGAQRDRERYIVAHWKGNEFVIICEGRWNTFWIKTRVNWMGVTLLWRVRYYRDSFCTNNKFSASIDFLNYDIPFLLGFCYYDIFPDKWLLIIFTLLRTRKNFVVTRKTHKKMKLSTISFIVNDQVILKNSIFSMNSIEWIVSAGTIVFWGLVSISKGRRILC